jgi:hypothetical protein
MGVRLYFCIYNLMLPGQYCFCSLAAIVEPPHPRIMTVRQLGAWVPVISPKFIVKLDLVR